MTRNLNTLSILHYVYGGITCLGGLAMLVIIFIGSMMNSDLVQHADQPPPEIVGGLLQTFGWILFAVIEMIGILIIASGRWIARRKNKTGSLVIAGFCCLSFPLGTALGIFTFITLLNQEVDQEYRSAAVSMA
ncbi:MAG TPA: resistance to Congo red protein [Flavobacteriales bacterium]|nr:resistance to Congo red protein [Flavobacteriales bacterium]